MKHLLRFIGILGIIYIFLALIFNNIDCVFWGANGRGTWIILSCILWFIIELSIANEGRY